MDTKEEQRLIIKAKRDVQAFGLLYDEYYPKIFGYVLKRTANVEVSQDITSETFFKALKNIYRFNYHGIPLSVWLCRIANHEIANHYRKNGQGLILIENITELVTLSAVTPESEIEDAEDELKKHQAFLDLHDNISRLPLKYQEVLTLRYFEKKQITEIGAILGKSDNTIKTLLYRGLSKLHTLLQQGNSICQDKQPITKVEEDEYGRT